MTKEEFALYKSRLVANLSHELKTPLSIIMAMSDTLMNDPELSDEQKNKYIERIHANANALVQLIDDIITLHKIETQPKELIFQKYTRAGQLFKDVELMVLVEEHRKLTFKCGMDEFNVNQQHMLSILVNLIQNAVDYTKSKEIKAEIRRDKGNIVISVIDEGPAIPLKEREKIFERFYTISQSRSFLRSGSGLGLPIVKHIAALYSGSVTIQESSAGGNIFTVTLQER